MVVSTMRRRTGLSFVVAVSLLVTGTTYAFSSPSPKKGMTVMNSMSDEDLLARAKAVLAPEVAISTMDVGECLADDFQFCAAVIGPWPKEYYLGALGDFQLTDSFDIEHNNFGFTVSPHQRNRVYWFSNAIATMKAPFYGVQPKDMKDDLVLPPQVFHMDFNDEGKVIEFGFYTVDRQYGNTGGLGGAFGFFYGVGRALPFPEGKPFKPSFRFRMLNFIGFTLKKLQKKKTKKEP